MTDTTVSVEDRDVTVAEAAVLFGVPRRTLYRWVEEAHVVADEEMRSSGPTGQARLYRLSVVARIVAARARHAGRRTC